MHSHTSLSQSLTENFNVPSFKNLQKKEKLIHQNLWEITRGVDIVCDSEGYDLPIPSEVDFSIYGVDRLFAMDHTTLKSETWVKLGLESGKY